MLKNKKHNNENKEHSDEHGKKEIKINSSDDEKTSEEISPESNNEEIEKLKAEAKNLKDALYRKAAEFENYKRRTENEISGYIRYASENLLRELLPVYDDLNRSVESVEKEETKDFDTLKKGMLLIWEKFKKVLENEGLKEIDCLGKEFSVDVNDALMQVHREGTESNKVVDVIEKGYYFKDKVIKHAKVVVSA